MTKKEIDSIIDAAIEAEIGVVIAKSPQDAKKEGLHIVEPNFEALILALRDALAFGVKDVYVHSRVGWPYKNDLGG